jgi:hypothetical protein
MTEGPEIVGRKPACAAQRFRTFLVVFRHGDTCSRPFAQVISQAIHAEQALRRIDRGIFVEVRFASSARPASSRENGRQGLPEPFRQLRLAVRLDQDDGFGRGVALLDSQGMAGPRIIRCIEAFRTVCTASGIGRRLTNWIPSTSPANFRGNACAEATSDSQHLIDPRKTGYGKNPDHR